MSQVMDAKIRAASLFPDPIPWLEEVITRNVRLDRRRKDERAPAHSGDAADDPYRF
jgi:hypothetical protein